MTRSVRGCMESFLLPHQDCSCVDCLQCSDRVGFPLSARASCFVRPETVGNHVPALASQRAAGLMRWIPNTVAVQRSVVFFTKKTTPVRVHWDASPSLPSQARARGALPPAGRGRESHAWPGDVPLKAPPVACLRASSRFGWDFCALGVVCIVYMYQLSVIHCRPNVIINEIAELLWGFEL